MTLPNLFIVGAPKAGTTSLANTLAQHPDIFLPYVKEPHHFGTDLQSKFKSAADYMALFAGYDRIRYRVDASTNTLRSKDAISQIMRVVPNARFIAILRDPIDAVPSFHGERRRRFVEPEESFETAWKQQHDRAQGKIAGPVYFNAYDYGRQIAALASLVPRDNFRIFTFSELTQTSEAVLAEILEFLDLPPVRLELARVNVHRTYRIEGLHRLKSAVSRSVAAVKRKIGFRRNLGLGKRLTSWNTRTVVRSPLDPALTEALRATFAAECDLCLQICGKDPRQKSKTIA
ncbi:MAG: sulfotransferase [Pseudomonadota bacterium]